jgi:hypothetical protein
MRRRALAGLATPAIAAAAMAGTLIATHHTALPSLTPAASVQVAGTRHDARWHCELAGIVSRPGSPAALGPVSRPTDNCLRSSLSGSRSRARDGGKGRQRARRLTTRSKAARGSRRRELLFRRGTAN